ncbi:MAG: iron-sulfur cluster repair di-iron protein [Bryobacterales bacterium]|nr:iron-sulfur cluster repair di-iron protein [Bryobacterales bacterium]
MSNTVSEIIANMVRDQPLRANVFERHQIDYCCNGKRSLEEVCVERGLDPKHLRAELEAVAPADARQSFATTALTELADHIVTRHHAYLRTNLPSIAHKAQRVLAVHGDKYAFLAELDRVFQGLSSELTQHMMKEEMVLFPLIGRLEKAEQEGQAPPSAPGGSIRNPIRMMEHEHDDAGRDLKSMRQLTSNFEPPAEACNTFRALYAQLEDLERDLHTHIHLENNILFPRAAELEQRLAGR